MNSNNLVAGVLGGLALFAMGFLVYVVLMADFFASEFDKEELGLVYIVIGEVVLGFLLANVMSMSNTSGVSDGAKCGAITGFLFALGMAFIFAGAYNLWDLTTMLIDSVVWAVRWAVAGAVIGWWFARGSSDSGGGMAMADAGGGGDDGM